MRQTISTIAGAAVDRLANVLETGVSVAGAVRDRLIGGDRHPDIEADAGHRNPPAEDLTEDPAYEPPEDLKDIKGG